MNRWSASIGVALLVAAWPAFAADDDALMRMALCRDSWFEWSKSESKTFESFANHVRANFAPHDNDAFVVPKGDTSVAGFKVVELYPDSVGMGVGFSLTVEATFDEARKTIEKALGKTLAHCEASDGMKSCELSIAKQRSVMLMAEDKADARRTLIGCYYFYEK